MPGKGPQAPAIPARCIFIRLCTCALEETARLGCCESAEGDLFEVSGPLDLREDWFHGSRSAFVEFPAPLRVELAHHALLGGEILGHAASSGLGGSPLHVTDAHRRGQCLTALALEPLDVLLAVESGVGQNPLGPPAGALRLLDHAGGDGRSGATLVSMAATMSRMRGTARIGLTEEQRQDLDRLRLRFRATIVWQWLVEGRHRAQGSTCAADDAEDGTQVVQAISCRWLGRAARCIPFRHSWRVQRWWERTYETRY